MKNLDKQIQEKVLQCKILQPVEGHTVEYQHYADLADKQFNILWPWDEPAVQNDLQDLRVHMDEPDFFGTTYILKLFNKYEQVAGQDYWTGKFMKMFPRPEMQRMAALNGAVELNSHEPFYDQVNTVLHLDTEEFYASWKQEKILVERMDFIGKYVGHSNYILSTGAFTFVEGAILYSSFGYLKHFQAQECGKNLITNTCRGINQSVADENIHAIGSAMACQDMIREANLDEEEMAYLKAQFEDIAKKVYEHESAIIDILYSKGDIKNLPKHCLKDFVKHRCNLCLDMLGFGPVFTEELDTFIESWFYKNINSVQFHDFFTGHGSEYNNNWDEQRFGLVWTPQERISNE